MRFALIDNKRVEAQPGFKGLCPGCSQQVIAKCGKQRIHHWAHLNNKSCDSWWEAETEWHRSWKNNFPVEWQEVFLPDVITGEKHVADVCTCHDFVIEFQHSHIDPKERTIREKFYKNMVWVLDGTRLKRDYPRFLKGKKDNFRSTSAQGVFLVSFPDECFPAAWIESSVPVVFDFQDIISLPTDSTDTITRNILWCLFPGRAEGSAVLAALSREYFVNTAHNNPQLFISAAHSFVNNLANSIRQERQRQANIQANMIFNQLSQRRGRRHFRC
ncbi:MAG: hypothetical protein FWD60_07070 [Candidatus Azobacteroides sp.]|nr:hypothetical protein [Candidatus Azobacteroides sp.]